MEKLGIPVAFISGVLALGIGLVASIDPALQRNGVAQTATTLVPPSTTVSYPTQTTPSIITTVATPSTVPSTTYIYPSPSESLTSPTSEMLHVTQATPDGKTYILCPFSTQAQRTIIDFTKKGSLTVEHLARRANGAVGDASVHLPTSLEPGRYAVHLASYHDTRRAAGQYGEWWKVVLRDASGKVAAESTKTRDLGDTESVAMELVDQNLTVSTRVSKVSALHAAYPTTEPNSVTPLCAALDRVGNVPVPFASVDVTAVATSAPTTAEVSTAPEHKTPTVPTTSTTSDTLWEGYRTCPIPDKKGRIIADFTKQGSVPLKDLVVHGDASTGYATPLLSLTLPRGTYELRLVSYGGSATPVAWEHDGWRGQLYGTNDAVVSETPAIPDVPEWESEFVRKVSSAFVLPREVTRIRGVHTSYPSTSDDPVAIICAAFDPLPSSVVPTSVSVAIPEPVLGELGTVPKVQGTLYEVSPDDLGIPSALRAVAVTEEVRAQRATWMTLFPEQPFDELVRAGTRERDTLLAHLFSAPSTTSSSSVAVGMMQHTPRVSDEMVSTMSGDDRLERSVQEARIRDRDGVDALRDTDGDGVTDYDEKHLYGTNPDNPFTGQGVLTDGERLLLGLDPTSDGLVPTVTESPKTAGLLVPELFQVDTSSTPTSGQGTTLGTEGSSTTNTLTISGTTKPLTFVTLFIYSNPIIVTVRTDERGHYEYALDEQLQDGSHELYVASVNSAGKIIAKSNPIPFVKTAQAIEFTLPPAEELPVAPVDRSLQHMLTFGLLTCLLLTIGGIVWLGRHTTRDEEIGKV